MAVLVTTPRLIGAGRVTELNRRVQAAWTQRSTAASAAVDCERTARCVLREEVLAGDGRAITALAVDVTEWSSHQRHGAIAHATTTLAGHRYLLDASQGPLRASGASAADEHDALELEYAYLGTPEPVDRTAHVIATGSAVRSVGDLVLALLMRHARGTGGYAPSAIAWVTATLVESLPGGDGRFEVSLATSPDPGTPHDDQLHLAGALVLGAHGWPRALWLEGTTARRRTGRFEVTTSSGTLQLELGWRYP